MRELAHRQSLSYRTNQNLLAVAFIQHRYSNVLAPTLYKGLGLGFRGVMQRMDVRKLRNTGDVQERSDNQHV